jgi:hypothetical protein
LVLTQVQNRCKTKHPQHRPILLSWVLRGRVWECTRTYLLRNKTNPPWQKQSLSLTKQEFIKSTWLFLIAPKRKAPQQKKGRLQYLFFLYFHGSFQYTLQNEFDCLM